VPHRTAKDTGMGDLVNSGRMSGSKAVRERLGKEVLKLV